MSADINMKIEFSVVGEGANLIYFVVTQASVANQTETRAAAFADMTKRLSLPMILRTETFLVFIATWRWWRWRRKRSLLVLYHVHVLVLLRGVHVGCEALSAHRPSHRRVRGEPKVRRRVAGMRHVVPRLALVVEVVHLGVV